MCAGKSTSSAKLAGVRQVMERVAKWLSRVPVVNWFENAGIVSWFTILLTAFLIGAGRKRYLLPMAPVLTALMVCIAAPTFNYQMRYIMPIMFCVPFDAAMAVQALRSKNCDKKDRDSGWFYSRNFGPFCATWGFIFFLHHLEDKELEDKNFTSGGPQDRMIRSLSAV